MKPTAIGENHLYSKVYQRGRRFCGKYVTVYVLADRRANRLMLENPAKVKINRIGITCTKKTGKAVVRSRVKRIMREAWRLLNAESRIKTGYLVVIAARDGIQNAKTQDILPDLVNAVNRLGLSAASG